MALIDKASLLMVPSTYEAGKLYNVLPSGNRAPDSTGENSGYDQTRADFDFDRGSNTAATRVNADGLIEKYRENIFLYSQDFSQSNWQVLNATKVSTNETDPNGELTACNITWAAGAGTKFLFQNVSSGNLLCLSMYVKSNGGGNKFRLFGDGATDYSQDFTATDEWQRFEFFFERGSGLGTGIASASDSSSADLLVAFAQVESGMVATDVLTSGATTAKAGLLIDLPRIDYSSGAGALLLEPSRQQLVQFSEYLSTFGGTATINDNAIISPEGLQNAAEVILSASGTDSFYKEVAVTANTKYTLSFYVKQGSNTNNQLAVRDQTNATFIATDVSYTASSTEWKRIEYTFTTPAGCVEARIYPHRSSLSSVGNGYFYGIQVEAGSYATSYIPNHGESGGVTRAADSCSVTGASDVIGQTEGTLFLDAYFNSVSGRLFLIRRFWSTTYWRFYIKRLDLYKIG